MCCKILSNVIEEANRNNYNNLILESYSKIKTIWETMKLESSRKNITEERQVLNIDGISTNNSQTITSALNKYFLLPDEKKCVTNNNANDDNNTRPDILLIDGENKTPLVIDTAVRLTHNLPKTEREKITKCRNLSQDINIIWKLNSISICLLVISVEGVVIKSS